MYFQVVCTGSQKVEQRKDRNFSKVAEFKVRKVRKGVMSKNASVMRVTKG